MVKNIVLPLLLSLIGAAATVAAPVDVYVGDRNGSFGYVVNAGGAFGSKINSTTGPANTSFYCVDDDNFISPPTTYKANLTALSSGDFSVTNMGNHYATIAKTLSQLGIGGYGLADTAETRYKLAAILISLYNPGQNNIHNRQIQNAIWDLSDILPSQTPHGIAGELGAPWLTTAATLLQSNANYLKWSDILVVSDIRIGTLANGQTIQEMLTFTPEPASIVLLSTAMLSLFFIVRRKRIVIE